MYNFWRMRFIFYTLIAYWPVDDNACMTLKSDCMACNANNSSLFEWGMFIFGWYVVESFRFRSQSMTLDSKAKIEMLNICLYGL